MNGAGRRTASWIHPAPCCRRGIHPTSGYYNAAILASANFVRGIQVYTGATPDGATVAPSIAIHLEHFDFASKRLVYDRASGTPKHIADVRRASNGQTQLVARQINYGQRHTRFAPQDFTLVHVGASKPMISPVGA